MISCDGVDHFKIWFVVSEGWGGPHSCRYPGLMTALLSLFVTALAALSTSGRLETACIRRAILGLPVAAVLVPRAARADDDLDDDDEVPMQAAIAPKNRKKPGDAQRTFSAADVKYAYADIVAAREALNTVGRLVSDSDLVSVAPLLGKPPFSSAERNLLALVQGPGLGPDAKIQMCVCSAVAPARSSLFVDLFVPCWR